MPERANKDPIRERIESKKGQGSNKALNLWNNSSLEIAKAEAVLLEQKMQSFGNLLEARSRCKE